jgi:gliding motility-associated-like protein
MLFMAAKNLNRILFALFVFLCCPALKAQDLPEFNMSDTTITECYGILYDSGGPGASYGVNENTVTVINTGGVLTLTFFGTFAFENNLDSLYIYNGTSTAAPVLGAYTGQTMPPVLTANSGAVTVVLVSDNNVSAAGFSFEWESTQPVPVPPVISVNSIPSCNASQLNINFSVPVQCAWLNSALFTVSANGQNIPVNNVQQNCAGGQTSLVTLVLGQAFTFNCNFLVNLVIQIPDDCGFLHEFTLGTSFLFQNCGINANVVADSPNVCPGGCTSIAAEVTGCFTYTYSWSNGLPPTAGPHNVCPAIATVYSVTISELETGNTSVETITIGIEDVTITTPEQTLCQSAPNLTLLAGTNGEWSGPGVIPGTNQFNPDLAGGGVHTIEFSTNNCSDSFNLTVTPIATESVTAACPGSAPFQLNAMPSGGVWSGPNTTPEGIFDPGSAGTFTVDYSVNGCIDQLTVNVDDIGGPFTLDPICQSIWYDTIAFSPFGGTWSGEGIVNSFLGVFAPSEATPGPVQLTYTINGCNQIFDVVVKEINVDSFAELCPDEEPQVLDSTPLPSGGVWFSPDGALLNTGTGLFNPSIIPNDTYTFITYFAPNGCVDTLFVFVIATDVEVSDLAFCVDEPLLPLDSTITGAAIPENGSWFGPGISGNVNAGFNFNPASAGLGTHIIYYSVNTCQDSIEVTIFPPTLPDTPFNFCSTDDQVELVPGLIDGGTWSGSGIVDAQTGLFDPGVANEGTYYVLWTNPAGCNDSILVTVETFEEPLITGINAEYCLQSMDVSFQTTPAGGILIGSLAGQLFNPVNLGSGSYQVIYRINPEICPQLDDTVNFVIHPALSLSPLIASANPICPDQAVTLTTSATGGNPNNTLTYTWSNGGISLPTNTSSPGQSATISVTLSDGCSVPVTVSADISVFDEFVVTPLTSDSLCLGEQGFATLDLFPPGNYVVTWNGFFDPDNFLEAFAGTTYNVSVTDVNGCEQDTVIVIPVFSPVVANFATTPNVACIPFEDMGNVIFTDQSANGVTGTWNFGNGISLPYAPGQSLIQAYPGPGEYTVTLNIANSGGCLDDISKIVCIQPSDPIFIPDIFSPNDDGRNDTLFVRGLFITKMDFRVYNRWGEEVFVSEKSDHGWDGQQRGQPASSGSYFYTLKATVGGNEKIEKNGEIILVR